MSELDGRKAPPMQSGTVAVLIAGCVGVAVLFALIVVQIVRT